MPSINLRLTDQQHQQLQAAAKTNRRSIQKEIVARLALGTRNEIFPELPSDAMYVSRGLPPDPYLDTEYRVG